jgi:hypothetical protein
VTAVLADVDRNAYQGEHVADEDTATSFHVGACPGGCEQCGTAPLSGPTCVLCGLGVPSGEPKHDDCRPKVVAPVLGRAVWLVLVSPELRSAVPADDLPVGATFAVVAVLGASVTVLATDSDVPRDVPPEEFAQRCAAVRPADRWVGVESGLLYCRYGESWVAWDSRECVQHGVRGCGWCPSEDAVKSYDGPGMAGAEFVFGSAAAVAA